MKSLGLRKLILKTDAKTDFHSTGPTNREWTVRHTNNNWYKVNESCVCVCVIKLNKNNTLHEQKYTKYDNNNTNKKKNKNGKTLHTQQQQHQFKTFLCSYTLTATISA